MVNIKFYCVQVLILLCCSSLTAGFIDVGSLLESVKDKSCKMFNNCNNEEKTTVPSSEKVDLIEIGPYEGFVHVTSSSSEPDVISLDCDKNAFESEIDDLQRKLYSALNELAKLRNENEKLTEEKKSIITSQESLIEKIKQLENSLKNSTTELAVCNSEKYNIIKGETDQKNNEHLKLCVDKIQNLKIDFEKCNYTRVILEEKLSDTEKGLNMAAEKTEECERKNLNATYNCKEIVQELKEGQKKYELKFSETLKTEIENCDADKMVLNLEIKRLNALMTSTNQQLENDLDACNKTNHCWETQYTSYLADLYGDKLDRLRITRHIHHESDGHQGHRRHKHPPHHQRRQQKCPQLQQC